MRLLANGLQISRFARNDSGEVAQNDSGERSAFRSRFAENSIAASSHCATMKERYHHQGVIPSAARDLHAKPSIVSCVRLAYRFLASLEGLSEKVFVIFIQT